MVIAHVCFFACHSDAALNVFMDVRKMDRKASLASVAGEVEMEEEGDGARLFQSEVRPTLFRGTSGVVSRLFPDHFPTRGSGQELLKISRVGSGGSGRVWSP